jgi:hypothetical protein
LHGSDYPKRALDFRQPGSNLHSVWNQATQEDVVTRNDLDPLILDLLEWIAREPRSYADVIEAWRTSCPRLTVWEDAVDRGFAVREHGRGREVLIRLTPAGRDFLREHGRSVGETTAAPDAAGSRAWRVPLA